ncbi:MFS transporter [Gammaproteobacteria bacterium]|nr:MFS transporter [Gammaproteobacteria bacterium]
MQATQRDSLSLVDTLAQLRDKRFLAVLLFGFCSGFPWVLHGSVLTLWLQQSGLSRSAIGFFGVIATVYAVNWLWAPFVDRMPLPFLGKRLGQRRSWIMLCLAGMSLLVLGLGLSDPSESLVQISLLALGIAICSATLDISVDAYRIMLFNREEMDKKMPYAAAVSTTGWFAGYGFIGGALAVALGGETIGMSWDRVYLVLAAMVVVLALLVLLTPRPPNEGEEAASAALAQSDSPSLGDWIQTTLIAPFTEFFQRCGFRLALSVLLLLLVFRLGEAMLGRMSLVFYVEVGFSRDEISLYQKFFGGLVTAGFSLLGAVINTRFGVIRGLFVAGIAMAGANLMFALIAVVGPNTNLLMLALLVDNFFQAFATVAFVSFISYFTSRTYTGTQYALMASVSNFGRTTLAAGSGFVIDALGGDWASFFILTTLMVIPGLGLLVWVGRLLPSYSARQVAASQP